MKNKKIYKILTFVLIIAVLFSVVCVNALAYKYEGNEGVYYIPDTIQKQEYFLEDFMFENPCRYSGTEGIFSFVNSSNHEFTYYSEYSLGFNNELSRGENKGEFGGVTVTSTSLTPHINYADYNNPVVFTFPLTIACEPSELSNFTFSCAYQKPENLETNVYDSVSTLFTFDKLIKTLDFETSSPYVEYSCYEVYVEALCDPNTNSCYLTFNRTSNYGNSESFSEVFKLSDSSEYLCFILKHSDTFQTGSWGAFRLGSTFYEEPPYISAYELKPSDEETALVNSYSRKINIQNATYGGMAGNINNTGYSVIDDYLPNYNFEEGCYELIKNDSDETHAQLWIPGEASRLSFLSSSKYSTGKMSFGISAIPRDFLEFKFVEGKSGDRWSSDWCIIDPFFRIIPVSYSALEQSAVFEVYGWGGLLTTYTAYISDPYANWLDVVIDFRLDPLTDYMYLDYYINDVHLGSGSRELTTFENSITSIYMTMRTSIAGTGAKFDSIHFMYNSFDEVPLKYSDYVVPFLDKISSNEGLRLSDNLFEKNAEIEDLNHRIDEEYSNFQEVISNKNAEIDDLNERIVATESNLKEVISNKNAEIDEKTKELASVNRKLLDYKNNAHFGELFPSISESIMIFLGGVSELGYTTPGGLKITIGGLLTIAVLGAFISFLLKIFTGRGD